MKGYVVSVIGIVIVSAVLSCIIPEGKTSSMIKGIAKTACVAVIVAPILQFFQSGEIPTFMYENAQENFLQSGIETDVGFIQYYSELQMTELEKYLKDQIQEQFDVRTTVQIDWKHTEQRYDNKYTYKEIEIIEIEKDWGEDLGISFETAVFDHIKPCCNTLTFHLSCFHNTLFKILTAFLISLS